MALMQYCLARAEDHFIGCLPIWKVLQTGSEIHVWRHVVTSWVLAHMRANCHESVEEQPIPVRNGIMMGLGCLIMHDYGEHRSGGKGDRLEA